ncbi:LytTR family DNA-binding domain-containing protein [Compostibacter hankyongensis]|uniref:LytTR family DNA-binding domain-containing protein n=1 Tax=Compostibacter hankyongensis TaxID=1007089 RepID=A0ABP8FTM3_9BACT
MLSCIIIDDEQHAIDLLKNYIDQIPFLQLEKSFSNPLHAIKFLNDHKADVAFVDIQMPQLSGIDFIRLVQGKTQVVITSAFKEYALEGYEHQVLDYLLKPITFDRFLKAAQRATELLEKPADRPVAEQPANSYIIVKKDTKNRLQKIELDEIRFIEGLKNYVSIYTEQQKIITLLNMKDLEDSLPRNRFIRIHKSYIISLDKVRTVEGNFVFLKNFKTGIPLGETYKASFLNTLRNHQVGSKKNG